jgi:hypothetical protein
VTKTVKPVTPVHTVVHTQSTAVVAKKDSVALVKKPTASPVSKKVVHRQKTAVPTAHIPVQGKPVTKLQQPSLQQIVTDKVVKKPGVASVKKPQAAAKQFHV